MSQIIIFQGSYKKELVYDELVQCQDYYTLTIKHRKSKWNHGRFCQNYQYMLGNNTEAKTCDVWVFAREEVHASWNWSSLIPISLR